MDDVLSAGLRRADPGSMGIDAGRLAEAVAFAETAETRWPRDLSAGLAAIEKSREPAPWNEALGPSKDRGGPNGLILKDGAVVASWGDIASVEVTFSAAKSYLSMLAGLAVADGLIGSIDDPVRDYALDAAFDTDQNRDITWRHLLNMTSEFDGSLWDKPDLVDRHRQNGPGADNSKKGTHRDLQKPGTFWEYNDVRVNRLSLCLMQVFRRPLPAVLKERIMDPIGASDTWIWHHYRNSFFEIDGVPMPSVPGGAHWGGGLWISSLDHARMGQLIVQRGAWEGKQLLPAAWIDSLSKPCPVKPTYGLLWWLNTGGTHYDKAPETSFFAQGAGQNIVWIDPALKLVVVTRWIDARKVNDFAGRVMASLA
ncbi:MAG: serine hydrolase [Proteobacteria bacterium]|nr:serine hydrolase [Pseudomonadota bacterium]